LFASGEDGVSVAVFVALLYATVAATGPPELESVNVEAVIVVASIARENVALTVALVATAVALDAGLLEVTVGATLTVVKLHVYALASATPSAAFTVAATVAV
jgi:hypothetical protein